jgi:hypothetical protein
METKHPSNLLGTPRFVGDHIKIAGGHLKALVVFAVKVPRRLLPIRYEQMIWIQAGILVAAGVAHDVIPVNPSAEQ